MIRKREKFPKEFYRSRGRGIKAHWGLNNQGDYITGWQFHIPQGKLKFHRHRGRFERGVQENAEEQHEIYPVTESCLFA